MPQKLTEYDKKIGERIKKFRIIDNVQQEDLGECLKLPKQAISRMENGKRRITPEELDKTAKFFKVPVQMFLSDDYLYNYMEDNVYGYFPVYMSHFLDLYEKALTVNAGRDNVADKYTKEFIETIKYVNRHVKEQLKTNEEKFRKYIKDKEKYCKPLFM